MKNYEGGDDDGDNYETKTETTTTILLPDQDAMVLSLI